MKVLLVSASDIGGGAALAAYRLRNGLQGLGVESRMLVRQKLSADDAVMPWPEPRDPGAAWLDELTRELSSTLRPRTPVSGTYFSLPWPGENAASHPAVQEADVLNLHWVTSFIAPEGLRNLLLMGKPVVLTLHDQRAFTGGCHYSAGCEGFIRDCDSCPQLREEFHDIARCALALSKACLDGAPPPVIVTPSRWLAEEARRSALLSHCRVEAIPNGLDLEIFRPRDRAAALEYFGLPSGARVILFGAHTLAERRKGFDVLLETIKRLVTDDAATSRLREQNVVFASYGLRGSTLRATGLPVYLLGEQPTAEDMARLLSASSLFICPTREDNLPNTVMEAMACGLPVLASNVGGVPDMITDGVHGRLVPPDDPAALAATIMDFAERPDTWLQWGSESRRKCEAQYSIEHQGRSYARLFDELTASCREPVVEGVQPASIAQAADAMMAACKHLQSKLHEEEDARVRREEEAAQARIAAEEAAVAAAKASEPNPKADLARVEDELRKCRRNPFWFLLPRGRELKRQRQALKDEVQQQKDTKRAAKQKPKPVSAPPPPRQPDATLGNEGGPLHDALLVISASEINGSHGTGVLLGRLLKDAPPFIHLRSMNLYGGKSEAAQRICVPIDAIASANVPELLNGSTVRRILSVPYDRSDVENTLAFHDATGAPLCVWLMDHNLGEGRRQIPHEKMKDLLDRAQLRLGISSEFCDLYRDLFKHEIHFAPPVVDTHLGQRTLLHLPAAAFQPPSGVLLGNVWSHIWMKKLVAVLTKANVPMVAFGNMSPPDVKNEKLAALLQPRGYLPEPELVVGLRQHPFALVPTGTLDEDDDLPSIARYSLPSRTLYLSAVGNLPIIVIGHADTGVAKFVTRHGLGIVVPYDAKSLREAVEFICDPDQQMRFRRQAAKLAPTFACDDMGEWLWKSLDMRAPCGRPLARVFRQQHDIMPSLKQYLSKLGLSADKKGLSQEAGEALNLALRDATEENKRHRKEIEQLRKLLEKRFGSLAPETPSPSGTMAGILRRLHEKGPRIETIIDIGASNGMWTKIAMEHFPQQHYLLVEAQPVHAEPLREFAAAHKNVEVAMAAAGAARGEIHFDASDPFGGQASPTPYPANNIVVPVTTLDHEVTARALPGPYLIKFDTHGFEIPILKGATQVLQQTSVIIMECYNFKISPDCLVFPEMCAHLQSLGFRCIDMADVMHRNYDQALWQMDLVFVRADRPEVAHLGFN